MSKLWKTKKQLETSPVKPIPKMREGQQPRLEEVGPTLSRRGRSGGLLDEVTKMIKDLQLSQVEAQKRFDNELAFLRDVFTKVPPPATAHAPALLSAMPIWEQRVPHEPGSTDKPHSRLLLEWVNASKRGMPGSQAGNSKRRSSSERQIRLYGSTRRRRCHSRAYSPRGRRKN